MKRFWDYLKDNAIIITATFAVAVIFNFLYSLVYLVQDCGHAHFNSLIDEMKIIAVVPQKTDELALKVLEEKLYSSKITKEMVFIPSGQAWERLKKDSYINVDFTKYSSNTLPNTFIIKPETAAGSEIVKFIEQLKSFSGVEKVIFDRMTLKWLWVFESYMSYSYLIFLILSSVLIFSVILLSARYLLIKNYRKFLPIFFMQGFAGFCGGLAGFTISFFSLSNIGLELEAICGINIQYQLFAFLSSLMLGVFISLFTIVLSKEIKITAY